MTTKTQTPPLRRTSPCEHGNTHEFLSVQEGCDFYTYGCKFANGRPRPHHVTAEKYPQEVSRGR